VDLRADLTRADRRLLSEMDDDGVVMDADDALWPLILDELGYARRPPQFERRTPLYGSMVVPDDRSLIAAGELVELIPLDDLPLDAARRFADGRSAYLVRQQAGGVSLATFRRNVQYEADMVEVQDDSGAYIVQRTPVLGVTRLFTPANTIEWTGYRWTARPNARSQHELLRPWLPQVAPAVLGGLLELAVHWLSPGRAGATLVLPGEHGEAGLDLQHSTGAPPLSVKVRHHYPALLAALSQTDLATLVSPRGAVERLGVGLQSSAEADAAVGSGWGASTLARTWGMRHRSAARYTYDQPGAVALVVSEDGPVTVFARGKPLSECAAGLVPAAVTAGAAAGG
jgi:Probable sensor domain DACNK/DisA bacterial checkpoint controller nucleotide-binding